MGKTEERKSQYKCNDCEKLSWTTLNDGCRKCSSKNIVKLLNNEIKEFERKENKKKSTKRLIIILAVIALLFLTKVLYITTEGCTLPIDIVLFDSACIFGSFGASIGATIAGIVLFGILGFIGNLIFKTFK